MDTSRVRLFEREVRPLRAAVFVATFVVVLAMLPSGRSAAATGDWFVDPAGSDANDCVTATTPCASISAAVAKAASGDRVLVAAATYREQVVVDRDLTIVGGWVDGFTAKRGRSVLDGKVRKGVREDGFVVAEPILVDPFHRVTIRRFNIWRADTGIVNHGFLKVENSIVRGANEGVFSWLPIELRRVTVRGSASHGVIANTSLIVKSQIIANGLTGLVLEGGSHRINDSTISRNRQGISTGAGGGDMWITRSTISDNVGSGGLHIFTGFTRITNSTITGNVYDGSFQSVAGLSVEASRVRIRNTTIVDNVDGEGGPGGVMIRNSGKLIMMNSIVSGNGNGGDCSIVEGKIVSKGHNVVGDGCGAGDTDIVTADPMLGPLAANGGYTDTHLPLAGSVVIAAGSPAEAGSSFAACPKHDQRLLPRPQGGGCDAGSIEVP